MSYIYDFPHTRKYDDDLGFLIEYYKEVKEAYDGTLARINELADYLETNIPELASEYLDVALREGRPARRMTARSLESISKLNRSLKSFRIVELM